MNENMELIMHVYKTSEMGVYSTTSLINNLKNRENKIKHVLEMELKEYENFLKKSEKILIKNKVELKSIKLLTKMSSSMGIMMETMKDNSDSAIAEMLIEGFTMGELEIKTKIEKYKSICDGKYLKIAHNFEKFHSNEIKKLKEFI